jgi:hypothetical protein
MTNQHDQRKKSADKTPAQIRLFQQAAPFFVRLGTTSQILLANSFLRQVEHPRYFSASERQLSLLTGISHLEVPQTDPGLECRLL